MTGSEHLHPDSDYPRDGLGRSCPRCGKALAQKGWCSTDPKSATDWVVCPRCGYEKKSNGYETVTREPRGVW